MPGQKPENRFSNHRHELTTKIYHQDSRANIVLSGFVFWGREYLVPDESVNKFLK